MDANKNLSLYSGMKDNGPYSRIHKLAAEGEGKMSGVLRSYCTGHNLTCFARSARRVDSTRRRQVA